MLDLRTAGLGVEKGHKTGATMTSKDEDALAEALGILSSTIGGVPSVASGTRGD